MILLVFLFCFLVFFIVKDQIACFQFIKANSLFFLTKCSVCGFISIHCVIATKFDYIIQYNRFRVVLQAVDSLNVEHEL